MALNVALPLAGMGDFLMRDSPILMCRQKSDSSSSSSSSSVSSSSSSAPSSPTSAAAANSSRMISPASSVSSGICSMDSDDGIEKSPSLDTAPASASNPNSKQTIIKMTKAIAAKRPGDSVQPPKHLDMPPLESGYELFKGFQYAELPDCNLEKFLNNRSQYNRLSPRGHIQEFRLISCKCCGFQIPEQPEIVPLATNTELVRAITKGAERISSYNNFVQQQQQQYQLQEQQRQFYQQQQQAQQQQQLYQQYPYYQPKMQNPNYRQYNNTNSNQSMNNNRPFNNNNYGPLKMGGLAKTQQYRGGQQQQPQHLFNGFNSSLLGSGNNFNARKMVQY